MSEKPISKKMADVLKRIANGERAIYMRYMGRFNPNAYYFLSRDYLRVTPQITALLARGFVEKHEQSTINEDHEIRVTDAGNKAVADLP